MPIPLISVVMNVYNNEQFLAEAIESILNQSFGDFEFIIVNDGSTDRSGEILESYGKKDPRLRIYSQENLGIIASANKGCSMACGRYIARMDGDDIAVRDRFRWQVDFLEDHPEVGMVGGAIEFIDPDGRVRRWCTHPFDDKTIRSAMSRLEGSFCNPATMMRRDVYLAAGGYRTAFLAAEDFDLWLRIGRLSQLANLEAVVLKYRIHPNQISQQKLVQQGLSLLGAIESVSSSEGDEWEEVKTGRVITSEVLSKHHVSPAKQEFALISRYRSGIWTLKLMGDIPAAIRLSREMFRASRWEHVERSLKAHIWLIVAGLYWKRGQVFRAVLSIGRAVCMWPVVAGHPLKPFLQKAGILQYGEIQARSEL